jgi:hypothetical protein
MTAHDPPTYQHYAAMKLVREAARLIAKPGERVIYRDAFRWKRDETDAVMPNHYEMFSLAGLAADNGYEIVHDFNHVAVIRDSAGDRGDMP